MIKEIKCGKCNKVSRVMDDININKVITPHSQGASLYFDLWHFNVQRCSNCGYTSRDISNCDNLASTNEYGYDQNVLKELRSARDNFIEDYILASRYYSTINDLKNEALCLIQAGDLVYNEIAYWKEYILTEDENCEHLYVFAENLYNDGIKKLKEYLDVSPKDIDMQLLMVGILSDMDDKEIIASKVIIQNLKKQVLSNEQKLILDYLENEI